MFLMRITLGILLLIMTATGLHAQSTGQPIYGLRGVIRSWSGIDFDDYLQTMQGDRYGVTGVNAGIERELIALRNRQPEAEVKVWGTLYEGVADVDGRVIIVSDLLEIGNVSTGGLTVSLRVDAPVVNVRTGPSTAYTRIAQVTQGAQFEIVGRSQGVRPWWLICCLANGREGWISGGLVITSGDTDNVPTVIPREVPALTPTPVPGVTPTPDLTSFQGWRASYFANPSLSSSSSAVVDVPVLDLDWGGRSPHPSVPADGFSARFERNLWLPDGLYRINARSDDGVRVWLNDQLVIDAWHGATAETYQAVMALNGGTAFRVEFVEYAGDAFIEVWHEPIQPQVDEWLATYFEGTDLSGPVKWIQIEPKEGSSLFRNWGGRSPATGVPGSNWSGKWQMRVFLDRGDYYFDVSVDDGVRLWLDGHQLLNSWHDGQKSVSNTFRRVNAGYHTITLEYYQRLGSSQLILDWFRLEPGGATP